MRLPPTGRPAERSAPRTELRAREPRHRRVAGGRRQRLRVLRVPHRRRPDRPATARGGWGVECARGVCVAGRAGAVERAARAGDGGTTAPAPCTSPGMASSRQAQQTTLMAGVLGWRAGRSACRRSTRSARCRRWPRAGRAPCVLAFVGRGGVQVSWWTGAPPDPGPDPLPPAVDVASPSDTPMLQGGPERAGRIAGAGVTAPLAPAWSISLGQPTSSSILAGGRRVPARRTGGRATWTGRSSPSTCGMDASCGARRGRTSRSTTRSRTAAAACS